MAKQRVPGLTNELMKKGKHFILIRNPLDILVRCEIELLVICIRWTRSDKQISPLRGIFCHPLWLYKGNEVDVYPSLVKLTKIYNDLNQNLIILVL